MDVLFSRAVSFAADKLCFEFPIGEWYKHASPLAVEDARLPNSGTVRVEAELIGERFVGKWRMFLSRRQRGLSRRMGGSAGQ